MSTPNVSKLTEKEARRFRELFKGRFDQATSLHLIQNKGSFENALAFILTAEQETIQEFLHQDPNYVQSLKRDAEKVASLLTNDIKATIRQFACKACNRYWWRRVPARKEVSKCYNCKVRYDPIPTDMEWGIGKFVCICGNEFPGFGEMSVTSSECYKCGEMVPISHMLPPRKNVARKTKAPHSCNAPDCIGHGSQKPVPVMVNDITNRMRDMTVALYDGRPSKFGKAQNTNGGAYNGIRDYSRPNGGQLYNPGIYNGGLPHNSGIYNGGLPHNPGSYNGGQPYSSRAYNKPVVQPRCVHPKANFVIHTFSRRHNSSGSTVTTFLSQGSLDNQSTRGDSSLASIDEDD